MITVVLCRVLKAWIDRTSKLVYGIEYLWPRPYPSSLEVLILRCRLGIPQFLLKPNLPHISQTNCCNPQACCNTTETKPLYSSVSFQKCLMLVHPIPDMFRLNSRL